MRAACRRGRPRCFGSGSLAGPFRAGPPPHPPQGNYTVYLQLSNWLGYVGEGALPLVKLPDSAGPVPQLVINGPYLQVGRARRPGRRRPERRRGGGGGGGAIG